MGRTRFQQLTLASMVVGIALLASPAHTMAQVALVGCAGAAGYDVAPSPDSNGVWPIPVTTATGGTLYEYRYIITNGDLNKISTVAVALGAGVKLFEPANGTEITPGSGGLSFECEGVSNTGFAKNVCLVRTYFLPSNSQANPAERSLYSNIVSHTPAGGIEIKAGNKVGSCSRVSTPNPAAPPAFANVPAQEQVNLDGAIYCIKLNPSGCPTGDAPFLCSDPSVKLAEEVINITVKGNQHKGIWNQGNQENAVCPRGKVVVNPTCSLVYIGGKYYPSPGC